MFYLLSFTAQRLKVFATDCLKMLSEKACFKKWQAEEKNPWLHQDSFCVLN